MGCVIRLVFLLRRQPQLSLADFHAYWLDQHGPLVASHGEALGIVRYTQTHRLDEPGNARMAEARGGMEPPYDGVAELWWPSEEAVAAAGATPEGRRAGRALLEDEARFIDLPSSPLWLAVEHPQVEPAGGDEPVARPDTTIVKLHFPLRHHADQSLADAQHYWRTSHGPLIAGMAKEMGILRYQQVHRIDSPVADALRAARGTVTEPYTGHAEAWTDRSAPADPGARQAGRTAIEDERRFIDFARSAMWVGKEHVVIDRR